VPQSESPTLKTSGAVERISAAAMTTRFQVVALALVGVFQVVGFSSLRHDDAYITFRYAENLALGRGFVFNVGQRIMGSSSPGHVLLCALLHLIFGHELLPSLASAAGVVAWILQAVAVLLLLRPVIGPMGSFFVASCIALGAAFSHRFVALDTNHVMALVLWAVVAVQSRRWNVAALLLAIAVVTRLDAVFPALILGATCIQEERSRSWRPILIATLLVMPWFVFSKLYFGELVPQSRSKIGSIDLLPHLMRQTNYAVHSLIHFSMARGANDFVGAGRWEEGISTATVLAWVVAVGGACWLVVRERRLWVLPAMAAAYFLLYLFLRGMVGNEWHLYPVEMLMTVFGLSAVWLAAMSIRVTTLRTWVAALLFVGLYSFFSVRTFSFAQAHPHAFWYGARDKVYHQLAMESASIAPGGVIECQEVGTFAYYSDRTCLDEGLLITRDLGRDQRSMRPRWKLHAFAETPPNYRGTLVESEIVSPIEYHRGSKFAAGLEPLQ
jgi:hypothetical protein